MPLPPYITAPLADPERYQTVYAAAARLGGRADGRAAPHGRPARRARRGRRGGGDGRARRRARHVPAGQRGRPDPAPHAQRALPRPAGDAGGLPRTADAGSSPSAPPRCGRWSRAAVGRARGADRLFIHRPYDWQRRRPAADQLPPAPHDAADDDRRLRRPPLARPLRHGAGRRLPLPLLRRRDAARSRAAHDGTRSASSVEAADGAARGGHRPRRRAAPTARRASCRSARGARCEHLSRGRLEELGAEIVLGNTYHLMLRPGAETVADLGGLGRFTGWDGLTPHRLGRLPGLLARPEGRRRRRHVPLHLRRLDRTASRPESAVATQELLGADIQMVLDVCPPLPSPDRGDPARGRAHRGVGRAGPGRAPTADDQALFGIVQGGVDDALRAESAQRTVELDFDGYGIGGLSVGETRDEMLPGARRGARPPAGRPAPLPDGRRRPGLAGRGRSPSASTSSTACMQTRLGRHGTALTGGRPAAASRTPATPAATSPSTRRARARSAPATAAGYLRHLFQVGEPTAARLLSLHNLAWTLRPDGPVPGRHRRRHARRAAARGPRRLGVTRRLRAAGR